MRRPSSPPTTPMRSGTSVEHKLYGPGVVQCEWGSWKACKVCYGEVEGKGEKCPMCGSEGESGSLWWHRVSGRDVFDVMFTGECRVRSINERWLTEV